MISRKSVVEGIEFIHVGDMTWAIDSKGALWTCARCADSRIVFVPQAHARWHATSSPYPRAAAKARADIYRSVAADIAAAELGDREAIGDDE